jgi:hypothetical protein
VKAAAVVCRFCGHEFSSTDAPIGPPVADSPATLSTSPAAGSVDTHQAVVPKNRKPLWIGLGAVAALGIVIAVAANYGGGGGVSNVSGAASAPAATTGADNGPAIPADEAKFIDAVRSSQTEYNAAANDMAKGAARATRRNGICQALQSGMAVNDWIGTIKMLSSNGDGKGVLYISVADDVVIGTWNNALSDIGDETLLDQNSTVFKAASAMKERDKVGFSGTFIPSDVDCAKESSMTLEGSMTSPAFIFRFASISAPAAPTTAVNQSDTTAPTPTASSEAPSEPAATVPATSANAAKSVAITSPPGTPQTTIDDANTGPGSSKSSDLRGQGAPSGQIANGPQAHRTWYYCDTLKAYYPYVRLCPIPWRPVAPTTSTHVDPEARQIQADGPPTQLPSNPN